MRQEDRKAFINDYLELCRQYGLLLDVNGEQEDSFGETIDLELRSSKKYLFNRYEIYMKGLI